MSTTIRTPIKLADGTTAQADITFDLSILSAAIVAALPPAPPPPIEQPPPPPTPPAGELVLRTLAFGNSGPYVVSVAPGYAVEASSYSHDAFLHYWLTRKFSWTWAIGADTKYAQPDPLPRMRMCVDGAPVSDWQAAVKGLYRFELDVPNGHHIAHPELEGMPHRVCARDFLVNDTGAELPAALQTPWTTVNRFDLSYHDTGNVAVQMRYPGALPTPKAGKMRDRVAAPVTARLDPAKTWARSPIATSAIKNTRRWFEYPSGDVGIVNAHKYHRTDGATMARATGPMIPQTPVRSGPRYVGWLGYVAHLLIRRGNKGVYFLETNGRFGLMKPDGEIINEGGVDLKPGALCGHEAVTRGHQFLHANTPEAAKALAHYEGQFRFVGDTNQLSGPKRMWEPWVFATAMRQADGSVIYDDGHEFWIGDTRNNRILFLDHWTAHSPEGFQPAHFPPPGYVQAAGPTGQSTFADFVGSKDGSPTDACHEPWGLKIRQQDGKLYWANFAGGSIYRCNLDGSAVEPVLVAAKKYTDAELRLTGRLEASRLTEAELRALVVDGPAGTASLIRPTAIDFDSAGNLLWVEQHTHALRKLDMSTGTVTTLAFLKSAVAETNMVCDSAGVWGAVDDIFTNSWFNNTDHRFDKSGAYLGRWGTVGGSQQMPSGPRSTTTNPSFYGWAIALGSNKLIAQGNASGNQYAEYTARLPSDPTPNYTLWAAGALTWERSGLLSVVHGPQGFGELGAPNAESLAALPDADLRAYLGQYTTPAEVAAVIYFLRWNAREYETGLAA
ncbi:MAG: hypothetical protein V4792_09975 [Pseudomonadota bacterium]